MEIRVWIKTEVSTVVKRENTALEVGSCSLLVYVRLVMVPTSGALLPLRNSWIKHTISFKIQNSSTFVLLFLRSNFLSAFQRPGEGHFIGILQLAAHRHAVSKSCHLDLHGPQKTRDVHGGCLTFRVRVGGHNDFPHLTGSNPSEQFPDLDVILSHMVQRADYTV